MEKKGKLPIGRGRVRAADNRLVDLSFSAGTSLGAKTDE